MAALSLRRLVLVALAAAAGAAAAAARAGDDFVPPRRLSEWKLFEGDGSAQRPAPGVRPFDVNMPLFSDYAEKRRFLRLPPGGSAKYAATGPFDFPIGTVLVKTFLYPHDRRDPAKGERLLETRLLVRRPAGWIGLPYVWNEAQDEATLKVGGGAIDGVSWVHDDGSRRSLRYIVPNANQCKGCHESQGRGRMVPLGATAANLNRGGQLERWAKTGALKGLPRGAPSYPDHRDASAPVALKARAYLDVNCAHCHNPRGPAGASGLDLSFAQTQPVKLGVRKSPVAAGRGTGGRRFDVVPGKPDESILLYRMESIEPGVMMPELGRRLADAEGIELVRRWIASLPTEDTHP